jgi:hypothetical protein
LPPTALIGPGVHASTPEVAIDSRSASIRAVHVNQPVFRTLRAAVFAALCVTVSLVLHLLAGGARVAPALTAAATMLTAAGAFALAGRKRGHSSLLGASFTAQYGMHHLFGGSLLGGPVTVDSVTAGSVAGAHHESGLVPGLAMLLAHALAAVLSAWWLERGESALATMLRLAACTLLEIWGRLAVPISSSETTHYVALPVIAEVASGVDRLLVSVLSGRGPPNV